MAYSTDVDLARTYATNAHRDQIDKAGKPYITHPERVAYRMPSDIGKVIAWLHDTVEDTDVTLADIEEIFGEETARAVEAITRKAEEDWEAYLVRVKRNEIARMVKINDLIDNSNLTRLNEVSLRDVLRQKKYNEALLFLLNND